MDHGFILDFETDKYSVQCPVSSVTPRRPAWFTRCRRGWAVVASGGQWLQWYIDTCPCLPADSPPAAAANAPFQSKMLGWNSVIQPDYTQNVINLELLHCHFLLAVWQIFAYFSMWFSKFHFERRGNELDMGSYFRQQTVQPLNPER